MKIFACLGFMLLGIIICCGGVPTDPRGYIGAAYWYGQPSNVATSQANEAM
jgi:amino acid transporter